MSAIDVLLEERRRGLTGDEWYVTEQPYVLEIKGATEGSSYFVFPLGPQEMTVKRIFRQSVVATMGGVIAEEQGMFVKDLSIGGNFGLYPKDGEDTTPADTVMKYGNPKGANVAGAQLSGPEWTRRLLRNFMDRYADLKADPAQGHNVVMCWYNFKDGEYLVVVPQEADLNRSSGERMLYPFHLQFRAIGTVDKLILPSEELSGLAKFLQALKDAFAAVKQALALIEAGFQEASALLGEVRYFVAVIDSVIDDVTRIADAARDFVEGVKDTINMGAGFINSTTALLESVLVLMEDATDLPAEVRQNFQTALDGLHAIQAQYRAFGKTYDQEAAEYGQAGSASSAAEAAAAAEGPPTTAAEAETQGVGSADATIRDAGAWPSEREFNAYNGFVPHVVTSADSLESLARRYMGDGSLWYEIATMNGLKYPYISYAGIPGTVRPGATIAIPWLGATPKPNVASDGSQSAEALYGTDLEVTETRNSRPGNPLVDLRVEPQTGRDCAIVAGLPNLVQAIQMRTWTLRGTMPLYPGYGRERLLGRKIVGSTLGAARVALRSTLIRDSRILAVGGMRTTITGDYIDFDVSVVPVGAAEQTTISTALV